MTKTLTKRSLGELVCNHLPLVSKEAEAAIGTLFDEINTELGEGREVHLHGFGSFRLNYKAARPGRNPQNGEDHQISARTVCTFTPGVWMKNAADDFARTLSISFEN